MLQIKTRRLELKITQQKLSELVGVSQSAVSQWENGVSAPSINKICRIAQVLYCTTDDLLKDAVKH